MVAFLWGRVGKAEITATVTMKATLSYTIATTFSPRPSGEGKVITTVRGGQDGHSQLERCPSHHHQELPRGKPYGPQRVNSLDGQLDGQVEESWAAVSEHCQGFHRVRDHPLQEERSLPRTPSPGFWPGGEISLPNKSITVCSSLDGSSVRYGSKLTTAARSFHFCLSI